MPTKPFAEWTQEDATKAATSSVGKTAKTAALFVDGDHWQGGAGWIGPRPLKGDDGFQEMMSDLETGFTSRNATAEVCDRHTAGVVGHEPSWHLTPRRSIADGDQPNPGEQALIDEAEAALTEWWDKRRLAETIYESTFRMLYARRSQLRIYVPPGLLTQQTQTNGDGEDESVTVLQVRDFADALDKLYVELPPLGMSTVVTDPATQRDIGIYVQKDDAGRVSAELTYLGDTSDANGVYPTVIRTVGAAGGEATFTLGGRITIYEAARDPLVTEQVMELQRALNLALSILPRDLVTGAFLERVITNAMLPGEWVDDDTSPGGKRYKPEPYNTGAGTTNFLTGISAEDPLTGKQTVASPGVYWRAPIEVRAPVEGAAECYAQILGECNQLHVLLGDQAVPSGRSRTEARADHVAALRRTARVEERRGRWLLETALAMAEALAGEPGRYTSVLRVVYEVRLDAGPVDPAERLQIAQEVKDGLRSRQSGQSAIGITDVDAENTAIASQPGADLALIRSQAEAMAPLIFNGATLEGAARLVGMTDEQIELLLDGQGDIIPPAPRGDPEPQPIAA